VETMAMREQLAGAAFADATTAWLHGADREVGSEEIVDDEMNDEMLSWMLENSLGDGDELLEQMLADTMADNAIPEDSTDPSEIARWCTLCSSAHEPLDVRTEAAKALGRAGGIVETAAMLVEHGAENHLASLIKVMKPPTKTVQGHWNAAAAGVEALAALVSNLGADMLKNVVEDIDLIHVLCSMSSASQPESSADAMNAGLVLCQMCSFDSTFVEHTDVVLAIVAHGHRPSSEAQEEAAWALSTLSASGSRDCLAPHINPVFELLLALVGESIPISVRMQAVWAIANLVHLETTAEAFAEPAMPRLLEIVSRKTRTIQEETLSWARGTLAAGTTAASMDDSDAAMHDEDEQQMMQQAVRALGSLLLHASGRQLFLRLTDKASLHNGPIDNLLCLMEESADGAKLGDLAVRAIMHACNEPYSASKRLLKSPLASNLITQGLKSPSGERQSRATACVLSLATAAEARDWSSSVTSWQTHEVVLGAMASATAGPSLPKQPDTRRKRAPPSSDKLPLASMFTLAIRPLIDVLCSPSTDDAAKQHAVRTLVVLAASNYRTHAFGAEMLREGVLQRLKALVHDERASPELKKASSAALFKLLPLLTPSSRRTIACTNGDINQAISSRHSGYKRRSPLAQSSYLSTMG